MNGYHCKKKLKLIEYIDLNVVLKNYRLFKNYGNWESQK